jgi:protein-L-isoaspartate O-methyltransferase
MNMSKNSSSRSLVPYGVELHRRYALRPLSGHIASAAAISGLARWLLARAPRHVVEIGAGIGTLTHCVLELGSRIEPPPRVDSIEEYPPCAEQLAGNLEEVRLTTRCRFTLYDDVAVLAELSGFDFLIVDGGDPAAMEAVRRLQPGGTVFVEGDRKSQVQALLATSRPVIWRQFISSRLRDEIEPPGGSEEAGPAPKARFDGGFSILRFEPTLWERVLFLGYRLRTAWQWRIVRPAVLRRAMRDAA